MSHDPKLKDAMAEIHAILDKHGIGGAIALASPTHAEFGNFFPAWSVIRQVGNGVRIRCKREDFASDEEQHQAAESTAHLVMRMLDCMDRNGENWTMILSILEKHWDIEHITGEFTPHRLQ